MPKEDTVDMLTGDTMRNSPSGRQMASPRSPGRPKGTGRPRSPGRSKSPSRSTSSRARSRSRSRGRGRAAADNRDKTSPRQTKTTAESNVESSPTKSGTADSPASQIVQAVVEEIARNRDYRADSPLSTTSSLGSARKGNMDEKMQDVMENGGIKELIPHKNAASPRKPITSLRPKINASIFENIVLTPSHKIVQGIEEQPSPTVLFNREEPINGPINQPINGPINQPINGPINQPFQQLEKSSKRGKVVKSSRMLIIGVVVVFIILAVFTCYYYREDLADYLTKEEVGKIWRSEL